MEMILPIGAVIAGCLVGELAWRAFDRWWSA